MIILISICIIPLLLIIIGRPILRVGELPSDYASYKKRKRGVVTEWGKTGSSFWIWMLFFYPIWIALVFAAFINLAEQDYLKSSCFSATCFDYVLSKYRIPLFIFGYSTVLGGVALSIRRGHLIERQILQAQKIGNLDRHYRRIEHFTETFEYEYSRGNSAPDINLKRLYLWLFPNSPDGVFEFREDFLDLILNFDHLSQGVSKALSLMVSSEWYPYVGDFRFDRVVYLLDQLDRAGVSYPRPLSAPGKKFEAFETSILTKTKDLAMFGNHLIRSIITATDFDCTKPIRSGVRELSSSSTAMQKTWDEAKFGLEPLIQLTNEIHTLGSIYMESGDVARRTPEYIKMVEDRILAEKLTKYQTKRVLEYLSDSSAITFLEKLELENLKNLELIELKSARFQEKELENFEDWKGTMTELDQYLQ